MLSVITALRTDEPHSLIVSSTGLEEDPALYSACAGRQLQNKQIKAFRRHCTSACTIRDPEYLFIYRLCFLNIRPCLPPPLLLHPIPLRPYEVSHLSAQIYS